MSKPSNTCDRPSASWGGCADQSALEASPWRNAGRQKSGSTPATTGSASPTGSEELERFGVVRVLPMWDAAVSDGLCGRQYADAAAPVAGYDRIASTLHWLLAALVLVMLFLGFYMVEVPPQTPLRGQFFNLHKSIGLLVLGLMIARTVWRLRHRPPTPLDGISAFNVRLASTVHILLYLLLIAQPAVGYVASSLGRYGVEFFGLPLPDWTDEDPKLRELFLSAHHVIARLLVALILLHVAGTLLHILQGKTVILRRILPWKGR